MNQVLNKLLQNKHTSGAAIIYCGITLLEKIFPIWFPSYSVQCKQTAEIVREMSVMYGLMMAGDSTASVTKTEADTIFMKKSDLGPTQPSTVTKGT